MYADMTKVAYCNSHSFAGTATNVDVCGGGGKVKYLEVYALVQLQMVAGYSTGGARVARSNVASEQEVKAVSMVVGYQPRADLWKMCYNVDVDTKNSQTFHAQCDKVGTAFVSLFISLAPLNAYTGFGHFNATGTSGRPKQQGVHLDSGSA